MKEGRTEAACGILSTDLSRSLVSSFFGLRPPSLSSPRSSIVSSNALSLPLRLSLPLSSPAALCVFVELQFAFDYASAAAVAMGIAERVVKEEGGSPQNSCAIARSGISFLPLFLGDPATYSFHFVALLLRLPPYELHRTALQMELMAKGREGGYCNSKPLSSPSLVSYTQSQSASLPAGVSLFSPSPPPIPQSNTSSSSSFDPDPSVAVGPTDREWRGGREESDRSATAAAHG